MTERIKNILDITMSGGAYVTPIEIEFDENDKFLSREHRESKRLCESILEQKPFLTPYSKFTGYFRCSDRVVGDVFRRMGHASMWNLYCNYYKKDQENLSTFEWQHATGDYKKVLSKGISGIILEIEDSLKTHTAPEEIEFLTALKRVAETFILWAEKCSKLALELSKTVENSEYKQNLIDLSNALQNVPKNAPTSFYEAVLTIYVCFTLDPDSVGTLDRYLKPYYDKDIENGVITKDIAKEYLQELFLMLQSATKHGTPNFTRGAESHFCIGGYLPSGEDGYSDLSDLILESLMELPTYIPQVTLRWTKKLPKETFKKVMNYERNDPFKRIAFQNDEKRIKCYTEICGFSYEDAVSYTTVGCNEPAFLGTVSGGTTHINILRAMARLFNESSNKIVGAKTFDEFYSAFLEEFFSDLDTAYDYDDKFNLERAKDINYLSSLIMHGAIEKARSVTRGTGDVVIASPTYTGIPNLIDSLIIVKQFVYDEQIVSIEELINAIKNNWIGYEDLRALILKKGDFFGNDTERSNFVGQKLYTSLYEYLKDKTNVYGYHFLVGDLIGYNEHHKWFGVKTGATPDGRKAGDALKFGLGQGEGKDRNGLTALLNSIAKVDKTGIGCGSTVTNVMIDEVLVRNDQNFEKLVDIFETYFKTGGVHFQLSYVSKEDLLKARENPEDYKNLRVRVSGFSDYFVKLNDNIKDDIIERTSHSR